MTINIKACFKTQSLRTSSAADFFIFNTRGWFRLMSRQKVKVASSSSELQRWVVVAKSWLIFVTPWTMACQAPLSTGFPRQEY